MPEPERNALRASHPQDGAEASAAAPAEPGELARELEACTSALVERVRQRLAHVRGGIEAEDIVQDALLDAWSSLARFEGAEPERLRAWLWRIAEFKTLDAIRKCRGRGRLATDGELCAASACADDADLERAEVQESVARLYGALVDLASDHRAVIMLRDVFGLAWPSVADLLARSVPAAQMLRGRACQELARAVEPAPRAARRGA